jgi:hypothetical protein
LIKKIDLDSNGIVLHSRLFPRLVIGDNIIFPFTIDVDEPPPAIFDVVYYLSYKRCLQFPLLYVDFSIFCFLFTDNFSIPLIANVVVALAY